ncbi:hypothetical protein [Chryseobacterium salviniae]|uniref:Uncharacterized protein n=1 Tax=Chryseobacterium salviniae TaxID=3101750 RepID=A0ABU6HVU9_9FLAO|nr:hypothetical protein [Chryseobacterium sp. T9W2-O]MEC3876824.1 hypothetical protein [Chryseobacterium sp. T9W2-O]
MQNWRNILSPETLPLGAIEAAFEILQERGRFSSTSEKNINTGNNSF